MRVDEFGEPALLIPRPRALGAAAPGGLTARPRQRRRRRAFRVAGTGVRTALLLLALSLGLSACGDSTSPTAPAPATPSSPSPQFSEAAFREAARITALAQIAARASARAGQFERDVKAVVDATFSREGAAAAFDHIVASGPNTLELHYAGSDRRLSDGDLLLIDIGATSSEHCADVTRTFPVSGRFTPRQEEIYLLVLDAHREAASRTRTGIDSIRSIDALIREFFRTSPLRAKDASGVEQTMDRFFIHSIGHYVGRRVHGEDTGWSGSLPVQPSQVLALEPGLYIASEGIGIRIEDTYLVTGGGLECLTCAAPKELSVSAGSEDPASSLGPSAEACATSCLPPDRAAVDGTPDDARGDTDAAAAVDRLDGPPVPSDIHEDAIGHGLARQARACGSEGDRRAVRVTGPEDGPNVVDRAREHDDPRKEVVEGGVRGERDPIDQAGQHLLASEHPHQIGDQRVRDHMRQATTEMRGHHH